MSKPDTWMPFYIGPYLRKTSRLTTEQHGAYVLLLLDYWVNGPPLDDDDELASITKLGPAWRKHRPKLLGFFELRDGRWHQKRADEELARAARISSVRSEASNKRHAKAPANGDANGDANAPANGDQMEVQKLSKPPPNGDTRAMSRDTLTTEVGEPLTGSPTLSCLSQNSQSGAEPARASAPTSEPEGSSSRSPAGRGDDGRGDAASGSSEIAAGLTALAAGLGARKAMAR